MNEPDYYKLDGQQLRPPTPPELARSREYLEWRAANVSGGEVRKGSAKPW